MLLLLQERLRQQKKIVQRLVILSAWLLMVLRWIRVFPLRPWGKPVLHLGLAVVVAKSNALRESRNIWSVKSFRRRIKQKFHLGRMTRVWQSVLQYLQSHLQGRSCFDSPTLSLPVMVWGVCKQWARQDGRKPHPGPSSGASVISFDFGFLNKLDDDDPKLVALFICAHFTKLAHVVPTPAKVDATCPIPCYRTMQVCDLHPAQGHNFENWQSTIYYSIFFSITCSVETDPVGSHQSNGAGSSVGEPLHARVGT